jgi:dephospho-CoA kinase
VKVIGLAGGIGSGKSTVSSMLAARGAVILDGDKIARELQEPGQGVFQAMVGRWGGRVVNPDGTLDRQAVADIVFTDADELAALNAITRPAIETTLFERIEEHDGTHDVLILDVALIGRPHQYGEQATIVVDVPVETAVGRLVRYRNMAEDDARARIAAQIGRDERKAFADFVIDNGGDEDALAPQVDAAWAWIESLPSR